MDTYDLSEVIDKSKLEDAGKYHVDTTRKRCRFSFKPNPDTGSIEFYLENTDKSGTEMFFSPYGWWQFWHSLCGYPLAGVDTRKISENLICQIASERIERQRDQNIRAKALSVQNFSIGKDKHFFRGYTTPKKTDFSTTTLLQALEKSHLGSNISVDGMPSFPDHVFHGRFKVEQEKGHRPGDPEIGLILITSEVNSTSTSLDACVEVPEAEAHMIIQPSLGVPTFTVSGVHKDLSALTESVEKALTKISTLRTEIKDHIKRSSEETISKIETAAPRYCSRYGLPKETLGAIQKEFNTKVSSGAVTPTRWGLAVATARVAQRHAEALYGSVEKRVLLESIAGSLIQTKVS